MNREWHEAHAMPRNATTEQRIAWHKQHTQHCSCRPFPMGLLEKLTGEKRPGVEPVEKGKRA